MFLKFPIVLLPIEMRDKILHKAADMFISYGFKSVTMDDIANAIGISKKTIYQHFENKTKLVEATTHYMFGIISYGIDGICELEKNPIEEIYDIKNFVMEHLKGEKSSPQYQLKKYYPKIYASLKDKQFEIMQSCVTANLERGKALKLYRENLEINFISRLYFNSMLALKDNDLFPLKDFSIAGLMENFLEYHIRGICTEKGLKYLNQLLKTSSN